MATWWVPLEIGWKLQDVQAGINVVITLLSFLASFIFIRLCWQRTARRVVHGSSVPVSALLSVSTPGEVFDLILLLHQKLLDFRYTSIFVQCTVVLCLSAIAVLSGWIARYSTGYGTLVKQQMVTGLAPYMMYGGMVMLNVDANTTLIKLKNASFPLDRLPEFLPDSTVDWVYNPSQWNSSWTVNCTKTPETNLTINATGNCIGLQGEVPEVAKAVGIQAYNKTQRRYNAWSDGISTQDAIFFYYGYTLSKVDTYTARVLLAAVHLHKPPKAPSNETSCAFGKGRVESSSMTRVTCNVTYGHVTQPNATIVRPDTDDGGTNLADSWINYYSPMFLKESLSNVMPTIPPPDELIRFYQMYTLLKDTQTAYHVSRPIDAQVTVVHVSTIFLGIASIVALVILLGMAYYWTFIYRNRNTISNVPQSKLDWMLQSIEAEDRPNIDLKGRSRHNATVEYTHPVTALSHTKRKKMEFQDAQYGGVTTTTRFSKSSRAPSFSSSTNLAHDGTGIYYEETPLDTTYRGFTLGESAVTSAAYPLRTLAGYQSLKGASTDQKP